MRVHLFEWGDMKWFPSFMRKGITDYLWYCWCKEGLYKPITPKLTELLRAVESRRIIDLCSGASGPLVPIQRDLKTRENLSVRVTMTDLYPSLEAFENRAKEAGSDFDFIAEPVDALDLPREHEGIRTMFSAFHHFKPESAKAILRDAVRKRQPIAIFEHTERTLANIIVVSRWTLFKIFFITRYFRPLPVSRIIFTYLIPLIPLCLWWDAVVSCLRTYTPSELLELTQDVADEDYVWESGKTEEITFLIGRPAQADEGRKVVSQFEFVEVNDGKSK